MVVITVLLLVSMLGHATSIYDRWLQPKEVEIHLSKDGKHNVIVIDLTEDYSNVSWRLGVNDPNYVKIKVRVNKYYMKDFAEARKEVNDE